jgi:enolase
MFVKELMPRIIKNSRGEKTIELKLVSFKGKYFSSAPSGKSRGKNEVEPYALGGINVSFKKLKILCSILNERNFLIKKLDDLKILNDLINRFEARHGKIGGNITYALETVFLKAAADDCNKELWRFIHDSIGNNAFKIPMPVGNCIGGGKHSTLTHGKRPDFQEFLLIPNEKTFSRAVTVNLKAYEHARKLLKATERNDENAWQTNKTNEEALETLKEVAKKYNLRIGLDVASSSFYKEGYYDYRNKELLRDGGEQVDYMERLVKRYKIFYLEDPIQEADFPHFKMLMSEEKNNGVLIVGDDLTTTHVKDVERAIRARAINAMIIKPNQVGSILEVAEVVRRCKANKIKMIFSHRSGETMDDAIADYCIGFGGDFIKCGIYGKERLIKLKRVIDIEKEIGRK